MEQLRSEQLSVAAEGEDALRAAAQQLQRLQAEVTSLGASLQGLQEQADGGSPGRAPRAWEGERWWERAASRISSMDERQTALDGRLKALRLEMRELLAQEAEQRMEALQRSERARRSPVAAAEADSGLLLLERQQLAQRSSPPWAPPSRSSGSGWLQRQSCHHKTGMRQWLGGTCLYSALARWTSAWQHWMSRLRGR